MGLDYKPWAAKHTAILSHRYEESYQLICDIGFTAGVFTVYMYICNICIYVYMYIYYMYIMCGLCIYYVYILYILCIYYVYTKYMYTAHLYQYSISGRIVIQYFKMNPMIQ